MLSTGFLVLLRTIQGNYFNAFIDLVAVTIVTGSLVAARKERFQLAAILLAAGPPSLAFTLVQADIFQGVHMLPQIALCMVTCILIFDRLTPRLIYVAVCLGMMMVAGYSSGTTFIHLAVFFGQSLAFAIIFLCFVYFFERQDAQLQSSIQEKKEANKQLNERVEELLVFSHIMSHDLKGPLTSIKGFADLLQLDAAPESKEYEALEVISGSASHMSNSINHLLMFAKSSSSDIEMERVELDRVFSQAREMLEFQIQENRVLLEANPLPAVVGNAELLKTVFYNLLTNAIKFQPQDQQSHQPCVRLRAVPSETTHSVFVEDNGIGIDAEFLPKIFAPFSRDHQQTYEGTGLGMSICKNILDKVGGTIEVERSCPEGTSIRLCFPKTEELLRA